MIPPAYRLPDGPRRSWSPYVHWPVAPAANRQPPSKRLPGRRIGSSLGPFGGGRGGREPAAAHRRADHQPGADKDNILDDVLSFERRHEGKLMEADLGEQEERSDRADHLNPEQEQRRPQVHAQEQSKADQRLPDGENEDRRPRREKSEGELVDGLGSQVLGWALAREELEHAKPEEDKAEAEAKDGDAVGRHPCREGDVNSVEDSRRGVHGFSFSRPPKPALGESGKRLSSPQGRSGRRATPRYLQTRRGTNIFVRLT